MSKKRSLTKPSPSTNLKTIAICSLFPSSRASSTRIQYLASLISSWIVSYFVSINVQNLLLYFRWSILNISRSIFQDNLLISSLQSPQDFINSMKFPRCNESGDSSWPLNAHPRIESHLQAFIEVISFANDLPKLLGRIAHSILCQHVEKDFIDLAICP